MKKSLLFLGIAAIMAACSGGKNDGVIEVTMPEIGSPAKVIVSRDLISDLAKARQVTDLKTVYDTLEVKNGHLSIPINSRGDSRYTLAFNDQGAIAEVYAAPGENLKLNVTSYDPFNYTVEGSQLMEDITEIRKTTDPIFDEYNKKMLAGTVAMEDQQKVMQDFENALLSFNKAHKDSPAVVYTLFFLQGEAYKSTYDNLTEEAKKSMLMPMIADQVNRANEVSDEMKAEEEARAEKAKGDKDAPDFTLKNLEGKDVSLKDFRGKWVILDFWGSWCGWCIKGIPSLKEAYNRYGGKIEVISIDCNESEADWRAGVKQYELPWVNVYNPSSDGNLLDAYSVEGFPTKVIVSPEGKIVDITVGEDPSFYERLASFVK